MSERARYHRTCKSVPLLFDELGDIPNPGKEEGEERYADITHVSRMEGVADTHPEGGPE